MSDYANNKSRSSSPASDNMTKATSDTSKGSKRKGTRSVSTLTPAQLARKRANDREAQRAIRARTKEHIENLERELEDLRSASSRDDTVQDLLRKNRALEEELHRLKESMGLPTGGPRNYYQPSYHHSPTSRTSAPGHVTDYAAMDMGNYDTLTSPNDAWPSTVPSTIPSTVSSPSSSGATDDLGGAYYPTSAPSLMDRPGMSSSMNSPTVSCISGKSGYDDIKPDIGCPPLSMLSIPQAYQPPPWNMYPMYYTASPAL